MCELDIIFNFEKAYFMLDELILGGEIQETSKKNVLKAISAQDLLQEVNYVYVDEVIFCCLPPNSLHQQSLSFPCLILAYSRKTLHESSKIVVELVPHFARIQFWPWPNSQAVALAGSVRIISFNNKQMVSLEKKHQFDKRKQDWLVQKFGLLWLQKLDTIQAESPLLHLIQEEDKRRLFLPGLPICATLKKSF